MNLKKLSNLIKWVFITAILFVVGFNIFISHKNSDSTMAENMQDNNLGINSFIATDDVWMYNITNTQVAWWFVTIDSDASIWQFSVSETIPINSAWRKSLYITGNNINTTTVPLVQIYDCAWTSNIIRSWIWTSSGQWTWYDLSSIPQSYNCVKIHISMVDDNGTRPAINAVNVYRIPKTVIDMDIIWPATSSAGE